MGKNGNSSVASVPEGAQEVFKGTTYRVWQKKFTRPDGSSKTYEYIQRPSGVLVIPIDKEGFMTLVRERRMLAKGEIEQWSLPGGLVEPRETPDKAAARELLEETGLSGELNFFARRHQGPRDIWDLRLFVASKTKAKAAPVDSLETKSVRLMDAVRMAIDGEIENDFAALSVVRYAERINRLEILEKEVDPRLIERGLADY